MLRIALIALIVSALAGSASAQVEVTQLAAPDAFSTPGRDTGLPGDLWRGTAVETARAVLPQLTAKPLSPAAAQLARRVLATGARGPEGSTGDAALAAARIGALIALGDTEAASRVLERTPGVDRSAELSRAAAESALLAGDTTRACTVAEGLSVGRGETYWLRLRAFCQAEAGRKDQAQLTFDLAQAQARDAVFGRLMGAKLAGSAPGSAARRNGLDYALSRSLGLQLPEAAAPKFDAPSVAPDLTPFLETGGTNLAVIADDLKVRRRLEPAILMAAAAGGAEARTLSSLAGFSVAEGKSPAGRNFALEEAVRRGAVGETALLVLWICADAGPTGPGVGDRVRILRALRLVGLTEDARAFLAEGLAGLK